MLQILHQDVHAQATRWRLIKSPPGAYRRQVLASITDADVLRCSHSSEMCIVSALLAAQHSAATSELVRLLSAMASDSAGRSYLMQPGSRVVPELFQLLKTTPQARVRRLTGVPRCCRLGIGAIVEVQQQAYISYTHALLHSAVRELTGGHVCMSSHALGFPAGVQCRCCALCRCSFLRGFEAARDAGDETRDTPLHQHTLALMQKLSLGRAAQSELISLGMPHWLVTFLERPDSLSELCLEYSMALLMNLCLRSAGRTAAETLPVLDALDAFIQVRNRSAHSAPSHAGSRDA